MKIQYASDLHLEFGTNARFVLKNPLIPIGDVLILVGDIACLNTDNFMTHPFWDWASENYRQVLIVPGNHEFYHHYDLKSLQDGEICQIRENVRYYYNMVVNIDGIDIILSTLWSKILPYDSVVTERSVADFRRIRYDRHKLHYQNFNAEHERCLEFIKKAVIESKAKTKIVATHHIPSFQLESPDFKYGGINGAFTVELADYIEANTIDYWIYGHSHRNIDKVIGKTRCVTNQLGYVEWGEYKDFKKDAYFVV